MAFSPSRTAGASPTPTRPNGAGVPPYKEWAPSALIYELGTVRGHAVNPEYTPEQNANVLEWWDREDARPTVTATAVPERMAFSPYHPAGTPLTPTRPNGVDVPPYREWQPAALIYELGTVRGRQVYPKNTFEDNVSRLEWWDKNEGSRTSGAAEVATHRVLAAHVHLVVGGETVVLPAGEPLPQQYQGLITHPSAFMDVPLEVEPAEAPATATEDPSSDETPVERRVPGGDDDVPTYDEWAFHELQAELKGRRLPAKGSTEELVARLLADDGSRA